MKNFYIIVTLTNETYIVMAESKEEALEKAIIANAERSGYEMQEPEAILLSEYMDDEDVLDISTTIAF